MKQLECGCQPEIYHHPDRAGYIMRCVKHGVEDEISITDFHKIKRRVRVVGNQQTNRVTLEHILDTVVWVLLPLVVLANAVIQRFFK